MSLANLPPELLDAICEPLASDSSTLANLSLTCTAIRPSATRVLYRSVSVSVYAHNLPVIATLANRPDLARLVRILSVSIDETHPVLRAFFTLLQRAIGHMPQLESLELLVDTHASWILAEQAGDVELSRLSQFSTSFPLDKHVSAFLARTPALRSLQICDSAPPDTQLFPDSHVPILESYTGPAALLPLVAFRPLTTIYLSDDLHVDDIPLPMSASGAGELKSNSYPYAAPRVSEAVQEAVACLGKDVQILSAVTSEQPAEVLEALALAFPNLVFLRLMSTIAFWDSPDMSMYSRIATTLESLPALNTFELSGMHWEPRVKSPSSSYGSDYVEKYWISPPVSPRVADYPVEEANIEDPARDFGFNDGFYDWAY